MDTLLVYYSFEGNTAYAAEEIAKLMPMDVCRLHVKNEPPRSGLKKFLHGGKSALFHEDPGLEPVSVDVSSYYDIILAFPVWAGTYPPAIEAFLKANPFFRKNVYLIACSASGNGKGACDKLTERLKGNTVLGIINLKSPLKNKREVDAQIAEFAARRN